MQGRPRSLNPSIEDFDRDAAQLSEARCINVSPFTARIEIGTTPGSPPRRHKIGPGQSMHLPIGYCSEFTGSGRQPVRATIESLTEREVYPKGPRLPMVVHEERAAEIAAKWREALDSAQKKPDLVEVSIPTADGAEPIKTMIAPPSNAPDASTIEALRAALPPGPDEEDQSGGPVDEPPPDHNDPIELPKAGSKKGRA